MSTTTKHTRRRRIYVIRFANGDCWEWRDTRLWTVGYKGLAVRWDGQQLPFVVDAAREVNDAPR
jgi:hypothetical protein